MTVPTRRPYSARQPGLSTVGNTWPSGPTMPCASLAPNMISATSGLIPAASARSAAGQS